MAISIARKMNALIFLVPEDIVDVRPRLVCPRSIFLDILDSSVDDTLLDSYFCWKSHEHRSIIPSRSKYNFWGGGRRKETDKRTSTI